MFPLPDSLFLLYYVALQLEEKAKEFKYLKGKLDNAVATKKQEFIQSSKPKVDEVLKDLVESEKYDLIMPREAVIYSAQSFDVTAKVIEKLNALK